MMTVYKIRKVIRLLGLTAVLLTSQSAFASGDSSKEYFVKAAFMYNFVKFVKWPGKWDIGGHSQIDICIAGEDPFGEATSIIEAESTPALQLRIVRRVALSRIAGCHVVFISRTEKGRLGEILGTLKGTPVLTVSEIDGFAKQGGMIGFVKYDNKVKLAINISAANRAELRIDPQLLEVAKEVISK